MEATDLKEDDLLPYPVGIDLFSVKILIIKPSALGDIVQALPVLTGLKRRWPAAHIDWIVNDSLRGNPRGPSVSSPDHHLPAQALDLARPHPGNLALGQTAARRKSTT